MRVMFDIFDAGTVPRRATTATRGLEMPSGGTVAEPLPDAQMTVPPTVTIVPTTTPTEQRQPLKKKEAAVPTRVSTRSRRAVDRFQPTF